MDYSLLILGLYASRTKVGIVKQSNNNIIIIMCSYFVVAMFGHISNLEDIASEE